MCWCRLETLSHRWITSLQFTLFLFQILEPRILRGWQISYIRENLGPKCLAALDCDWEWWGDWGQLCPPVCGIRQLRSPQLLTGDTGAPSSSQDMGQLPPGCELSFPFWASSYSSVGMKQNSLCLNWDLNKFVSIEILPLQQFRAYRSQQDI